MTVKRTGKIAITVIAALFMAVVISGCGEEKQTEKTTDADTVTAPPSSTAKPETEPMAEPPTPQAETGTAETETGTPAGAEPSAAASDTTTKGDADSGAEHGEMLSLARKSGCLACHSVDRKVVGPAWKDVAKRYAGEAGIRSQLIEKISKGGRGNWTDVVGNVAMPPYHPRVTREDIGKLVDFVLSLADE